MSSPSGSTTRYVVPAFVGAAVAVSLGVYAKVHSPTGTALNIAGFSSGRSAKAWLASIALAFGVVQVVSSFVMYGRTPWRAPAWIGPLHRWSGRVALLVSVPVAAHCLYALGLQTTDTRVLVHSLLGCFFYGLFAVKMLLLTRPGLPTWVLPVAGGAVFTALTGLWLSASLWFFTTFGWKL